jgi:oxalate---CoA ligase
MASPTLLSRIIASAHPSDCAIVDLGTKISYADLITACLSVPVSLHRRFVGVSFGISAEFIILFLGLSHSGVTVVPLNPEWESAELENFLRVDSVVVPRGSARGPLRAVCRERSIPVIEWGYGEGGRVASCPDISTTTSPCVKLYSSGTTGTPHPILLSHANIISGIENILRTIPLSRADTTIPLMSLFHVHGLVACVLTTLFSGGKLVILGEKFSPAKFWNSVHQIQPTWLTASPAVYELLLFDAQKIPSLKFLRSSSSPLRHSLSERLESVFHVPVLEAYGMTEAAYQVSSNTLTDRRPGTVGRCFGNLDVRIQDGEIVIRGPSVVSAGWMRTGDSGMMDSDGYLHLLGRVSEVINRGGEKICPSEIEGVVGKFDGVVDCACFPVEDRILGESVGCAIVGNENFLRELKFFLSSKLSKSRIPTKFVFLSELPRTRSGKVRRRHLAGYD